MYNSENLPLSPLKVLKKFLINVPSLVFLLPFIILVVGFSLPAVFKLNAGLIIFTGILFECLVALLLFLYEYYYYKLYYYNFTDDGAEIRKGVISRATGHVKYERLQNIYIDQDLLDRIFGLYDVHYETAGETSGFYSHVDGLIKENADKLTAYLIERSKNNSQDGRQHDNIIPTSVPSDNNRAFKNNQTDTSTISLKDCPMASSVVLSSSLSMFFGLLIIMAIFFTIAVIVKHPNDYSGLYFWLIVSFLTFPLSLIYNFIWYKNFDFSFGPERGEIFSKVIGQSRSFLYYDRIQDVSVGQGIIERIFGLFSISIETAGQSSGDALGLIGYSKENAEKIKNFLLEKSKKYHSGGL